MATHLIVDGYNLIGHDGGLRGNLEARRLLLIRRLADYRRRRVHRVTIVFDGWRAGWPSEHAEERDGLTVIYSREGEQADAVIARLARVGGAGVVAVSSDRAVQASVRAAGGVALSCGEFERRVAGILAGPAVSETDPESTGEEDEATGWSKQTVKKGNPRRRSKVERRKAAKLRKL